MELVRAAAEEVARHLRTHFSCTVRVGYATEDSPEVELDGV